MATKLDRLMTLKGAVAAGEFGWAETWLTRKAASRKNTRRWWP